MLWKLRCRRTQSLFIEYIDGGLDSKPKLLSAFQRHLEACDECRKAFEDYMTVVNALRSISSEGVTTPSQVYERTCEVVLKRVDELAPKHGVQRRLLPQSAFAFGVSAALVAMVFAIYSLVTVERRVAFENVAKVTAPTGRLAGEPPSLAPAPTTSVPSVTGEERGELRAQRMPSVLRRQRSKLKIARSQVQRHQPIGELYPEPMPFAPRVYHEGERVEGAEIRRSLERPLASKLGMREVELPEPIAVEPTQRSTVALERADVGDEIAKPTRSVRSGRLSPFTAPSADDESKLAGAQSPKASEGLKGPEGPRGPEGPKGPEGPPGEQPLVAAAKPAPSAVPPDVERAAEEKLKDIHRRQISAVHAIQESSIAQLPIEIGISQASPAVLNQRGLLLMSLRPRQNLENVRVLAYAPKFIDAAAVQALLSKQPESQSLSGSQLSVTVWEGNLAQDELQLVPVPINPAVPGAQEVRFVVESAKKVIGSWLVLYPVAKSSGQFAEDVGKQVVSVSARNWRLVDLCRYLANRVGSVVILPAELADLKVSFNMQNVQYEHLIKILASQLNLQARLSGNVTAISSRKESLQIELQQGR